MPIPGWLAAPLEIALNATWPARGPRVNGRRHGLWIRRLPGGFKLEETTWQDGLRHGTSTRWYLSGRKNYVGEWQLGKQTGEWFWFRRNGKLDGPRTGKYEDGLRYAAMKGFNDWNA